MHRIHLNFSLLSMLAITSFSVAVQGCAAHVDSVMIVDHGQSAYRIVIAKDASDSEKRAAIQLQSFLKQITDVKLPISTDQLPPSEREILLGKNLHLKKLGIDINFDQLGDDGFTLRTAGKHLVIAGGKKNGALYGVYAYLEDYLGCRWYTPKLSKIPKRDRLALGQIYDTQVPVFDYREVYYYEAMDHDFADRHKLNGNTESVARDGLMVSEVHPGWAPWCHSFFTHFVAPRVHLKDHPQYFSLIDGKRQAKSLCLTNPDVYEIILTTLRKLFETKPDVRYADVSSPDSPTGCQCKPCQTINQREGTPMGTLLILVNKLADELADEFPDRYVSTLAYWHTQKPPRTIRPAKNVVIKFAATEPNRTTAMSTPTNDHWTNYAYGNLKGWAEICTDDNLFIWDYVVMFRNLVSPFPGLRSLGPNMQMFRDLGAMGMMAQGKLSAGGEFAELKVYLLAKLIWDPDRDVDKIIDEFLAAYYGPAAGPIGQYIDLLHDEGQKLSHLGVMDTTSAGKGSFLTPELVDQYDALFAKAQELVADNKQQLQRVQRSHLPVMFARLRLGYGSTQDRLLILEQFYQIASRNGIKRLQENALSPEQFKQEILKALEKESKKSD